jgi:4-amino-4-deoxy-L-arabinose transferase-like glycosyltransferase
MAERLRWPGWLLLILYSGSLLLFHLGDYRTLTGHEGLVAQIAREMLDGGDWLVPRIAGRPWLEKPPLPHWCVAAVAGLAGRVREDVARLPSVLMGLAGVLAVAALADRWYGGRRGLLVGLITATSYYTVTYARLAEADIYLWALVIGCLALFGWDWVGTEAGVWQRGSGVRRWLYYGLLGSTQLVKGPLFGAVLVLLPCLAFAAGRIGSDVVREPALRAKMLRFWGWFGWFVHPGLLVCLGLALAWPIAILLRYPEAAELWRIHTFGRLGGNQVLNAAPWWYYATTVPWQIAPWTIVALLGLPVGLRRAWHRADGPDRFVATWFATIFVVLSAVAAKHHHYLIHALPPCAFWAAEGLERLGQWLMDRLAKVSARRLALAGMIAVSIGAALGIFSGTYYSHWVYTADALFLGLLAAVALVALVVALAGGQAATATGILFATLWLTYGWGHQSIVPKTDGYRAEVELLRQLPVWADGTRPVFVLGLEPSRLLFYSPVRLEVHTDPRSLARHAAQEFGTDTCQVLVLASLAHEDQLRKAGEPQLLAQAQRTHRDPLRTLALFRVHISCQPDGPRPSDPSVGTLEPHSLRSPRKRISSPTS